MIAMVPKTFLIASGRSSAERIEGEHRDGNALSTPPEIPEDTKSSVLSTLRTSPMGPR
jgi:hypothetical protein